jgi:hypothetical protein
MGRARHDDGRNGVLENQLFLIVGFEHDGILIKRTDAASQLNTAEKINRNN